MNQLREYRSIILIIFAIFAILLLGAYSSQTFTEQKSFLELFVLLGALLFVFSLLVVFAIIGFSSFALYLSIFLAAVIAMYGIEGAILVVSMTYLLWGLVFSIEVLLVDNDVRSATEWFKSRYTFESFKREYYAFYPMILILYILIELFPSFLHREELKRFSPSQVLQKMREILQ
ncbi:MAG: hypothetical protein U9R26_05710 [Campylobacterota bacterium]|nr:hypothetical protein [Campylobacterota bacterium]